MTLPASGDAGGDNPLQTYALITYMKNGKGGQPGAAIAKNGYVVTVTNNATILAQVRSREPNPEGAAQKFFLTLLSTQITISLDKIHTRDVNRHYENTDLNGLGSLDPTSVRDSSLTSRHLSNA